jgi:hypothetical protein
MIVSIWLSAVMSQYCNPVTTSRLHVTAFTSLNKRSGLQLRQMSHMVNAYQFHEFQPKMFMQQQSPYPWMMKLLDKHH